MSDRQDMIFVTGLAIHAYHGVMPHEGKVGQVFALDLALTLDLDEASQSDSIGATVSYDKLVGVATDAFCARRYRLIEAAAAAVAEAILASFRRVQSVRVTIHKPHAPVPATFTDVGVSIVRSRHD